MEKITRYRSAILYSIVAIVAALLLINVMLIYQNSLTIESSKKNQEDAERVKVNTLDIIRNLHRLDIGIRGYALVNNPALLATADTAKLNRDLIFNRLEGLLIKQQYPNMREFQILKDSITSYFSLTDLMLKLINEGKRTEFNSILDQDRGYGLWLMYKDFSKHVNHFE
ncbi:MAG TPA: hypothetical protein PKU83_12215, partial [Chryseolinea sp.]|nr:hypothetical protein [Chryseolinea sp.]